MLRTKTEPELKQVVFSQEAIDRIVDMPLRPYIYYSYNTCFCRIADALTNNTTVTDIKFVDYFVLEVAAAVRKMMELNTSITTIDITKYEWFFNDDIKDLFDMLAHNRVVRTIKAFHMTGGLLKCLMMNNTLSNLHLRFYDKASQLERIKGMTVEVGGKDETIATKDTEIEARDEIIAVKDKEIAELKAALANSKPLDIVDMTSDELNPSSGTNDRASKRTRTSEKSKSSLASLYEQSQAMVKVKVEAKEEVASAEREREAAVECPICFEHKEESFGLIPCGHMMCDECADTYAARTCPSCRIPVEDRLKLHK